MSSSARIDELRKKFDENPRRYFAPLANEYRKVGDFDQAIFICQEYLPQQPGHMSGHIVFGQALFEAKRLPEARTVFETALTLDPENLIALRHLADISRDLGETTAARGWYERVLQADPRNEEIAAIMSSMSAAGSPTAKTAETPVPAPAPAAAAAPAPAKPAPASAVAPTMELSAAAVQEMLRARQAAQQEAAPAPEKLTLDEAPTVEVNVTPEPSTLEGFETTSHEGLLDMPSGGMLGLEPTSAASPSPELVAPPATPDGLDTISLDEPADGLLDFDSFGLGGETPSPAPQPAVPSLVAPAMDFAMPGVDSTGRAPAAGPPTDGGHEPVDDFDFDVPVSPPAAAASPPPPAQVSIPTMVMDVIEDAIPAVMDIVEEAVPAVVDAVTSAPTVIMGAIRIDAQKAETKAEAAAAAERPAAPFVTETMAQLYLEQGHRAEAIEIYKQLVAARPGDAELRGRLDAIERGSGSRAPQTVEVPAGVPTSPAPTVAPRASEPAPAPMRARFAASGPSIRAVLRALFGIDGQSTNGSGAAAAAGDGKGAGDGEVGSIDTLFSAESVPEDLGPLASAFDGGYVAPSGSIDAVFASGGR